jgi:protein TonB
MLHPARLTEPAAERVDFAELPIGATRSPAPAPSRRRVQKKRIDVERAFELPSPLLVAVDLVLPELAALPDYQPPVTELEIGGNVDLADDVLHLGLHPSASSSPVAARHHAYDESGVDRTASPDPANPKPRYPPRMLARGVEARFVVYFVVDTSGVVDTASVGLPASVPGDFMDAVTEAMARWRFVPAELAGRRVRQLATQAFVFQMAERYSSRSRP